MNERVFLPSKWLYRSLPAFLLGAVFTACGEVATLAPIDESLLLGVAPVSCAGDVNVTTQAEVDAFNCSDVSGNLTISGGPAITNLNGLSVLTSVVGTLSITSNSALTNVDGLSALTSVGPVRISSNSALTNVDGLSGLTSIGGAPGQVGLSINNNSALEHIDGLSAVTSVGGSLDVWANAALTNIDGLSAVTSVGHALYMGGNNAALTNLDGLSALTTVAYHIIIEHHSALTNVDGLAALTLVGGDLRIRNDPVLSDCGPGLYAHLASGTVVQGAVLISNNAPGCSSEAEILASPPPLPCIGNVAVTSQAEVDAFNCSEVEGDLTISSGPDITNLTGLSVLTSVGGTLSIAVNSALPNVDGLSALTSVGNLVIRGNSALTNLDGLSALGEVSSHVTVQNNATLPNVDGLRALGEVGGDLRILNNPALSECIIGLRVLLRSGGVVGDVEILNNLPGCNSEAEIVSEPCAGDVTLTSQADVDAFYCSVVEGDLTISSGPAIDDLDKLWVLTSLGGTLSITANTALANVDGLSALTSVGNLVVKGNSALTNVDGLSAVTSVLGNLQIANNAALTNGGLSAVTAVGGIVSITSNAVLTTFDLSAVPSVPGNLHIENNSRLTNFDLSALTSVGGLSIGQNSSLTNVFALSALTSVGGDLSVYGNAVLYNVTGLSQVTSVAGNLVIEANPTLTNLDGLVGVTLVPGNLRISHNLALITVRGLLRLTSVGGDLSVDGNMVLHDITGLSAVTSVGGNLRIINNSALTNVDDLSALEAVGLDLDVRRNPVLSECSIGLEPILLDDGVLGTIFISDNATGCNSVAEIVPDLTPVGSDVVVSPVDQTTGEPSPVTMTFDNVTSPGETTVSSSPAGGGRPRPPVNFRLGSPATKFDVQTTATFSGSAEICINYTGVSFRKESKLKLLHYDDVTMTWENVTTSLDTVNDIICGSVTSFSPFLVAETNVAPVVTSITLPGDPVALGGSTAISASFTDENPGDVHTATIDWGDGQVTPGIVSEPVGATPGSVSGDHVYAAAGVYTVTVTVTEDVEPGSNLSGSRSSTEETSVSYVVIYDPNGGSVTGGGWINSPAGAYKADPDLTGKASFGFVSKYKKGASLPTGNTQFRFKAGDFNFHSTSYNWLVVTRAGTNAQYKGEGTINGQLAPTGAYYKFMIWAQDNTPGGDDTFRIKIWYENGGDVEVYDNGSDQPLGGGSIVIHTK